MPDSSPSFETLFDQHMARLWAFALRLCGAREDAEDLLQEAAILGFRAFERFEPNTNFAAWMSMILVNAFHNRLRTQARRVSTLSLDTLNNSDETDDTSIYDRLGAAGNAGRDGNPQERLFEALDGALIARAFAELPVDFRACCALFWVSELSYEQIARALDIPIGTVRSRLHRGRRLLQRALWSLALERGIVKEENDDAPGTSRGKANLLKVVFWIGVLGAGKMFP